jgi:hypothetical protein
MPRDEIGSWRPLCVALDGFPSAGDFCVVSLITYGVFHRAVVKFCANIARLKTDNAIGAKNKTY